MGSLLPLLPLPQRPELRGNDSPQPSATQCDPLSTWCCTQLLQDLQPSGGFNFPAELEKPQQGLSVVVTE